jgi:parallel beta-helix repeat protein
MRSKSNNPVGEFLNGILLMGMTFSFCSGISGLPAARAQAPSNVFPVGLIRQQSPGALMDPEKTPKDLVPSSTWYVAPTGDDDNDCLSTISPCETIQAAINKAISGDSVSVAAGTYHENLFAKDGVNLSGAGMFATIVDAGGVGKALFAQAGVDATIQKMAFTNSGTGSLDGVSNAGVVLYNGNVTLTRCRSFSNPVDGITMFGGINTISYNLIDQNLVSGIFISSGSNVVVQNNTIVSSTYDGVTIFHDAGISVTVLNNIIASNGGYGISGDGTVSTIGVNYNDVWGNGATIDPSITVGTGNLYLNPRFRTVGPNDYFLMAISPVINMGDPDIQYYDPDGTRNDMGAFPFHFTRIFLPLVKR